MNQIYKAVENVGSTLKQIGLIGAATFTLIAADNALAGDSPRLSRSRSHRARSRSSDSEHIFPYFTVGVQATDTDYGTKAILGGRLPLMEDDNNNWFIDAEVGAGDNLDFGADTGYRHLFDDKDNFILGANIAYDHYGDSESDGSGVVSVGAEFMSKYFDVNLRYYQALTDEQEIDVTRSGNTTTTLNRYFLSGPEVEARVLLPIIGDVGDLRLNAGYRNLEAKEDNIERSGPFFGASVDHLLKYFAVDYRCNTGGATDSDSGITDFEPEHVVRAMFQYPAPERRGSQDLEVRLNDPVRRASYPVVTDKETRITTYPTITPDTTTPGTTDPDPDPGTTDPGHSGPGTVTTEEPPDRTGTRTPSATAVQPTATAPGRTGTRTP